MGIVSVNPVFQAVLKVNGYKSLLNLAVALPTFFVLFSLILVNTYDELEHFQYFM